MLSSLRARFFVDDGGVLSMGEGSRVLMGVTCDFEDIISLTLQNEKSVVVPLATIERRPRRQTEM